MSSLGPSLSCRVLPDRPAARVSSASRRAVVGVSSMTMMAIASDSDMGPHGGGHQEVRSSYLTL